MQKLWFMVPVLILAPIACIKSKKSKENTENTEETQAPATEDSVAPAPGQGPAENAELTLSKLIVLAEQIDPPFDPFVHEYSLLGGETYKNKITINTAPVSSTLDILINGVKIRSDFTTNPLPLVGGANLFTIDLVDSSGTKVNTYKLNAQRIQELPDETLADIAASDGELMPAFAPDVTSYQLTVGKDSSVLTISPLASYSDESEFEINGITYPADRGGYDINLAPGTSTITIIVKGKSGRTRTYTVAVTRPAA
jgi:hypothetical protein